MFNALNSAVGKAAGTVGAATGKQALKATVAANEAIGKTTDGPEAVPMMVKAAAGAENAADAIKEFDYTDNNPTARGARRLIKIGNGAIAIARCLLFCTEALLIVMSIGLVTAGVLLGLNSDPWFYGLAGVGVVGLGGAAYLIYSVNETLSLIRFLCKLLEAALAPDIEERKRLSAELVADRAGMEDEHQLVDILDKLQDPGKDNTEEIVKLTCTFAGQMLVDLLVDAIKGQLQLQLFLPPSLLLLVCVMCAVGSQFVSGKTTTTVATVCAGVTGGLGGVCMCLVVCVYCVISSRLEALAKDAKKEYTAGANK